MNDVTSIAEMLNGGNSSGDGASATVKLNSVQASHRRAQLIELACDFMVEGLISKERYYKVKYLIKSTDQENMMLAERILLAINEEKEKPTDS